MSNIKYFSKGVILGLAFLLLQAYCKRSNDTVITTTDSVVFAPEQGPAKKVRLQIMSNNIIRVTAVPHNNLYTPRSLMVNMKPDGKMKFSVKTKHGKVIVETSALSAEADLNHYLPVPIRRNQFSGQ